MKVIVFPLAWNEHVRDPPITKMHECEAMITPHIGYIKQYGAIYFDANWPITSQMRELRLPVDGYIYVGRHVPDAPSDIRGMIGYKVKVEKILTRDELLKELEINPNERKYLPFWREQCLYGMWPDLSPFAGEKHEPSRTWLKLSNIEPLPRGIPPSDVIENQAIRWGIVIDNRVIQDILRE